MSRTIAAALVLLAGVWACRGDAPAREVGVEAGARQAGAVSSPPSQEPRGTLVFQSDREGRPKIYTIDLPGRRLTRLTDDQQYRDENPRWSPDGRRILFKSNRAHYGPGAETGTPDYDLYVMNADGTGVRRLTTDPANENEASWLPDGGSVVYTSDRDSRGDLYRLWLADGRTERLTHHFVGRAIMPTVSPDGTRVAFAAQTLNRGRFWLFQVHVLTLATGKTTAVDAGGGSLAGLVAGRQRTGLRPARSRALGDRAHRVRRRAPPVAPGPCPPLELLPRRLPGREQPGVLDQPGPPRRRGLGSGRDAARRAGPIHRHHPRAGERSAARLAPVERVRGNETQGTRIRHARHRSDAHGGHAPRAGEIRRHPAPRAGRVGRGHAQPRHLPVEAGAGLSRAAGGGLHLVSQRFLAPLAQNEPYLSSALALVGGLLDRAGAAGLGPERVAVLGFSQGACLALEFAARHARRYKAIVGFSGALIGPPGSPRTDRPGLAGTPVFLGCSDSDFHVPEESVQEAGRHLRGLGGEVDLRIYPGMGHTINEEELAVAGGLIAP